MPAPVPSAVEGTKIEGTKAQRTYRSLVESTRAQIATTNGFTAELVAQRAGVAAATFYAHFPSKDDVLAAALDEVLSDLVTRTLDELQVEKLLEHGLRSVVTRAVSAAVEVFRADAGVFRLALARLPESRAIRRVYRRHQEVATADLTRFLKLGVAAGKVAPVDPDAATVALLVFFQGLNNPLLLQRNGADDATEMLIDMVDRVLSPPA